MSTDAINPSTAESPSLRQEAAAFWRGRSARERQALGVVLLVLVLLFVWLLLVLPAWRTVRDAPAQIDRIDRQLQQVQSTAAEVRTLRAIAPVSSTQAAAALKAATDRLGERARLSLQGERATLTFAGVETDDLAAWLNEVRSAARARPIEASLARVGQGYSGTLSVTLGGVP
jgi:general secretion pathway protein M